MCCRYYVELSPELRPIVEEMNRSPLTRKFLETTAVLNSGEIRPTNVAPVIASSRSGERAVFPMRWGFTAPGKPLLINARTETAAERPTFRDAWKSHRCIVPASWYFEWEHRVRNDGKKETGDKYLIQPRGSATVWMCGLYRIEEGLPAFVVLTREAAEPIRFIHDRMPLMLPEERIGEWIRPDAPADALAAMALEDMVFEKAG